MADPLPLSSALRSAAEAEREVALDRVEGLRAQTERLRALADAADADLMAAVRLLQQLEEISVSRRRCRSARSTRSCAVSGCGRSRSRSSKCRRGESATVHYREWYDLLVADGHRIAGKDPVATFLTQVSRAPEVESVGRRTGMYRLVAA